MPRLKRCSRLTKSSLKRPPMESGLLTKVDTSFTVLVRYATLAILPSNRLYVALPMPASPSPRFQVHWSLVCQNEAGGLVPRDCRLLAIWPAPVNHDVCFKEAGFSLFGDNDADWDQAAERLLGVFSNSSNDTETISLSASRSRTIRPGICGRFEPPGNCRFRSRHCCRCIWIPCRNSTHGSAKAVLHCKRGMDTFCFGSFFLTAGNRHSTS